MERSYKLRLCAESAVPEKSISMEKEDCPFHSVITAENIQEETGRTGRERDGKSSLP